MHRQDFITKPETHDGITTILHSEFRWMEDYTPHQDSARDRAEITKAGTTWRTILTGADAAHIIHALEHGPEDAAINALVSAHYQG